MANKVAAKIYKLKHKFLFDIGAKHHMIGTYSEALLEKLRNVYYGGIPASIILLSPRFCSGYCYDRALLITAALEDRDYVYVHADIDGIRYSDNVMKKISRIKQAGYDLNPHYANHAFIEITEGSITWVIDPIIGLVMEKHLYYLIERPKITKVCSKEETMAFIEYQDIKNADLDRDKYSSHLLLPFFEEHADEAILKKLLLREIELYKQRIDYDGICREIEEDKARRGISK